jgi:hypothetical protein
MNKIVSIYKSVFDSSNPFNRNVIYALNRIKNGNSKDFINQLRVMSDEDYQKNKNKLPGVCFNGKFKTRSASGLIEHSGLIVLDFDKFNTIEEAQVFKDSIISDEFIFAAWISPSGKGVKVLVKIPANEKDHKAYFEALKKHFDSDNWDDSGKDVSRFCYESFDPEIYINEDSSIWIEKESPDIEDIGVSEPIVRMTSENQIIENLIKWWNGKYGMNKGSRNTNLHILASSFNRFGVNESDAEHECLKYQSDGFSKKEIEKLVESAYKRVNDFNTVHFEDVKKKEKIEKLIRSGKSKKELEKQFDDVDISILKDNIDVDEFWQYNDKGKITLSIHKFKFWLEQNNFHKYYPSENSQTFSFIKKDQNLLEETTKERIKDFVLNNILDRPNVGYGPYDFMAQNTSYFKSEFLSMLSTTDVKIKKDTKDECYIYFKNCVVKVTKGNIETIDYLDIDGYVWKKTVIDADFEKFDHHDSEFRKFIWLISGQNVDKYNSFKSVIGYLLHSYKTSANNKAVILNDETISENPNGGSGKGLFWNALKNMKKVSSIDGKTFDFKKAFPYQTVSTDTQILVFDDVEKNFNFEKLFSLITEGITLEYKNQGAVQIPVADSPKLLITTNYTINGNGGSFERRKVEMEMSSYFNENNTPLDVFKHMLFDDWDKNEWKRFYNYMINCIQYYLKNGIVTHEFNNLHIRKFIKETCFEFYEWSLDKENLPLDVKIDRKENYNKFICDNKEFQKWLTPKRYFSWLRKFAKHYNYDFDESQRTPLTRYVVFNTQNNYNNEK